MNILSEYQQNTGGATIDSLIAQLMYEGQAISHLKFPGVKDLDPHQNPKEDGR
jgi:hypothetical protein